MMPVATACVAGTLSDCVWLWPALAWGDWQAYTDLSVSNPPHSRVGTETKVTGAGGFLDRKDRTVAEPFDGKSILVVDDDPDIVTAITAVFDQMGAKVITATDGNKAIDVAASDNPDLVVLDAMLPGRSGFLVLEHLKRAGKETGHCPGIIMITGNQGKRHQVWAKSLGVDAYLNKPFRMERLVQSAEELLAS